MGTLKVQERRKGQVMVQVAITLGPNCKKLEYNGALVAWTETKGSQVQFHEDLHACTCKNTMHMFLQFHFQTTQFLQLPLFSQDVFIQKQPKLT